MADTDGSGSSGPNGEISGPPFQERYGPWALVAGASDGVGAEFARVLAQRGVNVVLLSRRQAVLDELAAAIRAETGVATRARAIDLAADDAVAKVLEATSDLEVGMVVYCAGADPNYEPFLDHPVDVALSLVQRNCVVPLQLCHHFAGQMRQRGRGALVVVSSGAALAGAPFMVAYGASKAFDLVMTEALWAELHDEGVDVLSLVLGMTDTPALRRLLAERGFLSSPDDPKPIPGAMSPVDVVGEAMDNLTNGPTWFAGELLREGSKVIGSMSRSDAVRMLIEHGGLMANLE